MTPASTTSRQPDTVLLERAQRAIAYWQSICDGVTSSITGGGAIRTLEQAFSERLDGRFALAMPSGTAALRVALEALGVDATREVICSVYDWPAALAAIRSLGARPVLADIDRNTATINPNDAARRVSPRTRAVVATHLFGIPADVPRLTQLIDPLGVAVVEDCAQALGATIDDQPVGTLGTAAAFSFGPGKAIDAGEGGLVTFKHHAHYLAALRASQHPVRQLIGGVAESRLDGLGLRMHPLAAILALEALSALPGHLAGCREHARAVHRFLNQLPDARPVRLGRRREPSWYQVPFVAQCDNVYNFSPLSVARAGATLLEPGNTDTPTATEITPRLHIGEFTSTTMSA